MSSTTERVAFGSGGGVRPLAATFTYYAAFIGLGLIAASLGPTLPALAAQTNTALSAASILFTARSVGYLLGSLLGGRVYDRLTGHPVMALAIVCMIVGMSVAPFLTALWGLALVLLAIGTAEGTLDVGGNTLLLWIHRSKVGPYMNALHLFFGVGAFLSPLVIAQAMVVTGSYHWGYWLLALYSLPIALWLLRLQSPRHEAATVGGEHQSPPVNWRLVGLIMLFMSFYVGAEVGVGGWLYSYAVEMGLADTTSANYLTAVYWGSFTLGRVLSIPIATRVRPRVILMVDLIGCLASVGLMILLPSSQWAIWVGAFFVGLFVASIFPTVITWAERRMSMTGQVTSMFLVGSSIGGIILPWLIGQLFGRYGAWITMPAVFATMVVLFGVFLLLMANGGTPKADLSSETLPYEADGLG